MRQRELELLESLPEAAITLEKMKEAFRERLSAAYMLGSFARNVSSTVSDIDFAVILTHPISDADAKIIDGIVNDIQLMNLPYASRLSVFWGSVESLNTNVAIGRFPPLDRLDLIKHGCRLYGNEIREQLSRPTQRELIIAGAQFALEKLNAGKISEAILDPEQFFPLLPLDNVNLTKIILMPVRLLYTALTGEIGYNDESVAYYALNFPGQSAELVKFAFHMRKNVSSNKESRNEEVLSLLQNNSLHALYQQFIEKYISKLRALNAESSLIERMEDWHSTFSSAQSQSCASMRM